MKRLLVCSFALIVLAACQPAASVLSDAEKASLADSMTVVLQAFWDAWAETDFDRSMSFYLDSPDMAFAWGAGRTIIGYSTADSMWRPMFAGVQSQTIDMQDTHIVVLTRDVVTVTQRGTYAANFSDGGVSPTLPFAFTTVWVRSNGEWKVIAGHQSDTDPQGG